MMINMRLGVKTLKMLDDIQTQLEYGTRADAVRFSSRVAKEILDIEKNGSKLVIRSSDGTNPRTLRFL